MPTSKKPSKPRASAKKTAPKKTAAKKTAIDKTPAKKPGAKKSRRGRLPDGISMDEMTRIRAYELWEERGGANGGEEDDWMRAETEVRARYGAS